MPGQVSGHVYKIQRKRGAKWYARYRGADGKQAQKLLGPAWTGKGRPPAGYLTKKTAEAALSEIIKSFNERHGTQFTKEDLQRFERVNTEILDADMVEMLRNNPPDVVYSAFSEAFLRGAIGLFQRDAEMKSIVLTDAKAREQATRYFFGRALRAARA